MITLWGKNGDVDSLAALRFLKEKGFRVDRLLDLERQPPDEEDLELLAKLLGGDLAKLFLDQTNIGVQEATRLLRQSPGLLRCPILLTPKGAMAGFRERQWARFLDLGPGRGDD